MSDITEAEMVERLVDGAGDAADCIREMCQAITMMMAPTPNSLIRFRRAMKDASGSAGQLAHAQQNPAYLTLRDQMEAIVPQATQAAMSRDPRAGLMLAQIGTVLDGLRDAVLQIAVAKSVPRPDVLAMLDERKARVH